MLLSVKLLQEKEYSDYKLSSYKVGSYKVIIKTDKNTGQKSVNYILPFEDNKYLPQIYAPDEFEEGDLDFRIQTTSYGALTVDEFEEFIKGQQEAAYLVEYYSTHKLN